MTILERLTMRRCRQVANVLQAYLDGEVDPATAHMVHDHLEECLRCGLEAHTYRAIKTAIPMAKASTTRIEVDPQAIERLRRFAEDLSRSEDTTED
jgi:anti-sigma factor RsiW